MTQSSNRVGLVLSGALAKGAYHAGVLQVIATKDLNVTQIVGASAGSINAAAYAAGVITGRTALAAEVLEKAWESAGSWIGVLNLSLTDLLGLSGASTVANVQKQILFGIQQIMNSTTEPNATPNPNVVCTFVGTDMGGYIPAGDVSIDQCDFEREYSFSASDFATAAGQETIAATAAASSAFPFLFAPVLLGGRYIADGGIVNNTPLSFLTTPSPSVDTAIVITGNTGAPQTFSSLPSGITLIERLADIVVYQRLFEECQALLQANASIAAVTATMTAQGISAANQAAILAAIGMSPVKLVQVAPSKPLSGSSLAAFSNPSLYPAYIAQGVADGNSMLAGL